MASKAQLLLPSVKIPQTTDPASLLASTNLVLSNLNTQLQQISSAFTLVKPTVSADGTSGGIFVGNIIMGPTNFIRGGATGYNQGTGFWLGYDTGAPAGYKFFVGSSAGNKITWDGSALNVTGTITATSGTIGGWNIGATTISALSNKIVLDSTQGSIRAGQTNYATGTGFWLGNTAGTPQFSIGSSTNYLKWDGTNLLMLAGSGANKVIVDTTGFQVGTASSTRVAVGTYGGNPASLNFYDSTNASRLGLYLNGTVPSISFLLPGTGGVGTNFGSWDTVTGGDYFSSVFSAKRSGVGDSNITLESNLYGTPTVSISGPTGSLFSINPYLSITNSTTSKTITINPVKIAWTSANANLYESAANTLKTDGTLIAATGFSGDGSLITNINAANITGTISSAILGSGTANSSTWLRGDRTWQSLAASATTDTTNASNISSGTLNNLRLPSSISVSYLQATTDLKVNAIAYLNEANAANVTAALVRNNSKLEFYAVGNSTYINESNGLQLNGDATHPVKVVGAAFRVPNGSTGAPSLSFVSDTNTGWRWNSAGDMRGVCSGSDVLVVRSSAIVCLQPLKLNNNYVSDNTQTIAGYVTIQDGSGTTYKVLCAT